MKNYDLQLFAAEENLVTSQDLEPAISIDFTSRLNSNINALREVLGITELISMPEGSQINIYKSAVENTPEQVAEGEIIPLTKVTTKLARTETLVVKKYRKAVSAKSIQTRGYENAVNQTDKVLLNSVQKDIKKDFFALIAKGTGSATGTNLQKTISACWSKLQKAYEDEDVSPAYFVSSDDAATYLGDANITTQEAMGLIYIQNFLGLGTLIVSPTLTAGKVYATAKENLNCAYSPASSSSLARAFSLTSDETGFVGMTHQPNISTATLETLLLSGVLFFPERLDGVIVGTISGVGA